jgi:hypothetical protein
MSDQVVYTVQLLDVSDPYSGDSIAGEWIFTDEALANAQVDILESMVASAPGDQTFPDYRVVKYPTTISISTTARNVVALGHNPGIVSWPVFGDEAIVLTACARVDHTGNENIVEFVGTDPVAVMAAITAVIVSWPRISSLPSRG